MADDALAKPTFKAKLLGWLLSRFMRFVFFTSRKQYSNLQSLAHQLETNEPFILVSWHNRNILACFGYLAHKRSDRTFVPLASASRDGTIAAMAMHYLGVDCIRGSSSKGGSKALRKMLRTVKIGNDLGITPDGPRGPKYIVQPGVVSTARMTGIPIIPMAYQARRKKILASWDAMIVPWPFNRLEYAYGDPIRVPKQATEEEQEGFRQQVENELNRLVTQVDAAVL